MALSFDIASGMYGCVCMGDRETTNTRQRNNNTATTKYVKRTSSNTRIRTQSHINNAQMTNILNNRQQKNNRDHFGYLMPCPATLDLVIHHTSIFYVGMFSLLITLYLLVIRQLTHFQRWRSIRIATTSMRIYCF